jgi:predicted ABC-type ATPase
MTTYSTFELRYRANWIKEIHARCEALLTNQDVAQMDAASEAAIAAMVAAGADSPRLWFRTRLGLKASEERVLWLLIAHSEDAATRLLLRDINSEPVNDPTLATILRVAYGDDEVAIAQGWRDLAVEGQLQKLGLVEAVDGNPNAPEYARTYKASRRAIALANGEQGLDPALSAVAMLKNARPGDHGDALNTFEMDPASKLQVERWRARHLGGQLLQNGNGAITNTLILLGANGCGRRSMATAMLHAAGRHVIVIDAKAIVATSTDRGAAIMRAIARECALMQAVAVFCNVSTCNIASDVSADTVKAATPMAELILAHFTPMLRTLTPTASTFIMTAAADCKFPSLTGSLASTIIEFGELDVHAMERLWRLALPALTHDDVTYLADTFPLRPALIHAVGATMARNMAPDETFSAAAIQTAIRQVLDHKLSAFARRIVVKQNWQDVVLHQHQRDALLELIARVQQRRCVHQDWGFADKVGRGLGIAALFSGPAGTGKTMIAGLIATDLGLDLYQVDASKIASKWIGETEQNLARLFDAADSANAVLLFDEADALFGKRTDVKSSNDKHANSQVNYLLQRLETFRGVIILTSNHAASIDDAFARRLAAHIRFAVPEIDERATLWQACIPTTAPTTGEFDWTDLAEQFVMTGGYIRNAVMRAAFLASSESSAITMDYLRRGGRNEYLSMGKLVTE